MHRVGIGYDVHQLIEDRPLILGGVRIDHERGLLGHSDADVLTHAVADAVLGALGKPDIGYYFPPSDPDIEGIHSLEILAKCRELADAEGFTIQNVDATLVAERPRIRPHVEAMKANLASALGIQPTQVGVKATTNEKMGFLGREEGMAAMAVCCVERL